MQGIVTPEELANKLVETMEIDISIYKPITQIPFDLEQLHSAYVRVRDLPLGEAARNTFQIALNNWTDNEIEVFLCKWLFDKPHSTQLEIISADNRRRVFEKVFSYLFEGQKFSVDLE